MHLSDSYLYYCIEHLECAENIIEINQSINQSINCSLCKSHTPTGFSKAAVECRKQGTLSGFQKAAEKCLDCARPWVSAMQQESVLLVCTC